MRVHVTKYALTEGIKFCRVDSQLDDYDYVIFPGTGLRIRCRRGRDSHVTEKAALKRAVTMAEAKIKAHKRAIARLTSLQEAFAERAEKLP
jgi:hypothetical protein